MHIKIWIPAIRNSHLHSILESRPMDSPLCRDDSCQSIAAAAVKSSAQQAGAVYVILLKVV